MEWLEKLSEKVQVGLQYTQRLHRVICNRAWYMCNTGRKLKHGRDQRKFLEKEWKLEIHPDELSVSALEKENQTFQEELAEKCLNGRNGLHLCPVWMEFHHVNDSPLITCLLPFSSLWNNCLLRVN